MLNDKSHISTIQDESNRRIAIDDTFSISIDDTLIGTSSISNIEKYVETNSCACMNVEDINSSVSEKLDIVSYISYDNSSAPPKQKET